QHCSGGECHQWVAIIASFRLQAVLSIEVRVRRVTLVLVLSYSASLLYSHLSFWVRGESMRFRSAMCVVGSLACTLLLAGSAMAQGGEFVGAEWGVPGHTVDVTARVRTFIHDGVLQLEVTRFNLAIDPAPHQNKTLIIRVREWDG